jgi:hypothetical protein
MNETVSSFVVRKLEVFLCTDEVFVDEEKMLVITFLTQLRANFFVDEDVC